ncbi:helix-turn-helix domain-containing protein [Salmonella enterica]|nr:helix-turn-helix domain-containing protein [Salmonella enterica]
MITLNSKAQLTVDVIAKVAERKITIANAAKLLSKSRRTIERYLQLYREKGLQFVVHGNAGSEPANKTDTNKNVLSFFTLSFLTVDTFNIISTSVTVT